MKRLKVAPVLGPLTLMMTRTPPSNPFATCSCGIFDYVISRYTQEFVRSGHMHTLGLVGYHRYHPGGLTALLNLETCSRGVVQGSTDPVRSVMCPGVARISQGCLVHNLTIFHQPCLLCKVLVHAR